jgi:hypothetical protein
MASQQYRRSSPWLVFFLAITSDLLGSGAVWGADVTFTAVGFLPGDDHSGVEAVTVAVGYKLSPRF